MKVFISSLIAGFEPFRAAARVAVTTLRHEPIMAEDFGAQPNSPQIACMKGLRSADAIVLILGEHYGAVQANSGLSATHEEYREARGNKAVIAFLESGVSPEPEQAAFISEVQGWEGGLFRGEFRDAADLQAGVTRALHDYELANAVGPADPAAAVQRATDLLPAADRHGYGGNPYISISVAGEPKQQLLRPAQIEAEALGDNLHQLALFGPARVLDPAEGVQRSVDGAGLVLSQETGAQIQLHEDGSVVLRLPLRDRQADRNNFGGMPVLIEEIVQQRIAAGLRYAGALLEQIDPTQRLTSLAVAARIDDADYLGWRSQREHDASPNSMQMGMGQVHDRPPVTVSFPRPALRLNTAPIIEDLLVPLRRQWKAR